MFTADQVTEELEFLIQKYPSYTGSVPSDEDGYEEFDCVYYTDADGNPVNLAKQFDYDDIPDGVMADASPLVKPVCIVGHWIEEFHPELKQDKVICRTLLRNGTVRSLRYHADEEIPFSPAVLNVLEKYQTAQDATKTSTWSQIHSYFESGY